MERDKSQEPEANREQDSEQGPRRKSGNIHEQHRERLKKQFVQNGIDGFDDHNVLELLLFYAVARKDVNPIAHSLLNHFQTLAGVFDARYEELVKVEGVGDHTATLIKLIPQVSRRYLISRESRNQVLNMPQLAAAYVAPYFFGVREERVYLLCLDAKCKAIGIKLIERGTVDTANVSIRKVVEAALSLNSVSVVMAHNHPSGNAIPSEEDRVVTQRVYKALKAVDVNLLDHIIVADGQFVSMLDSHLIVPETLE